MATNPLLQHGAQLEKPPRFAPIWTNRFFTGLWTQRNPLRDAATPYIYEKFYAGARYESLIGGVNCEISNKLTLIRRPGNSVYNSAVLPAAVNRFYSFRQFAVNKEKITVLADTPLSIYDVTTNGSAVAVISKGFGAGSAYFQSVGNVLYIGDGFDQIKWKPDSSGVFHQFPWGMSPSTNTTTPLNTAGTGANSSSGVGWTNPGNVSSTTNFATVTLAAGQTSAALQATNFGFAVPAAAQVGGITMYFDWNSTGPGVSVQLYAGGVAAGDPKVIPSQGSTTVTMPLGSGTDLWNTGIPGTLSPSMVNASSFGVQITASSAIGGPGTVNVRNVRMQINTLSAPTAVPGGSGTLTTTNGGWKYVWCWQAGPGGQVSNPSPAVSTGNFNNEGYVTVTLPTAPADPEATLIRVFRTTDGGSTYFELPGSPYPYNVGTVLDTTPDSGLNIFSQAPTGGVNAIPPVGLINLCYHESRMWGSVNNVVYYSLPPNFNVGVGVESWPPLNDFVFPSAVTKLVPTTVGLLVFTISDIYLIYGNGTSAAPFGSVIFCNKIGLLHYDALTVSGTVIMMMSSAGEVLKFDPVNSINALTGLPSGSLDKVQIGFPIGDVLQNTYNPANAFVTWHHAGSLDQALYVADGSIGWYRWLETTIPEGTPAWSPQAQITGGTSCVQSVETSPGKYQLLIGPSAASIGSPFPSAILARDLSTSQDAAYPYSPGSAVSYSWNAVVGSVILAQPGQVAQLDFLTTDANSVGSGISPFVAWLRDEISGTFESLPNAVPDPYGLPIGRSAPGYRYYFEQNGDPVICRHLQLQFSGAATNTADELLAYTIYGAIRSEK